MSETAILITILGSVSAVLMLARRELGFNLLILVVPFANLFPATNIRGLNLWTFVIYSALAVTILASPARDRTPNAMRIPILALIGVTLLSTIWCSLTVANYPFVEKLASAKRWFDYFLLYFIFRLVATDRDSIRRYTRTLFIGYSLLVLHVGKEFLLTDRVRLYGTTQSNELGTFLVAYWALCVLFFIDRRTAGRALASCAIGLTALTGLLYTFSRGAYLAFLVGLLVFFMYLNRKVAIWLTIAVTCLFAITGFNLLPDAVASRIQSAYRIGSDGSITLQETAHARTQLARAAVDIISDYPIMGTGWGCLLFKGHDRLIDAGTDARHVIHNMYLQIFAELGLLGFVPFMLILWFAFVEGNRLFKRAPPGYFRFFSAAYLSCLAAFVVSNLFGNRMFFGPTAGYFWIMSALMERSLAFANTGEEEALDDAGLQELSSMGSGASL